MPVISQNDWSVDTSVKKLEDLSIEDIQIKKLKNKPYLKSQVSQNYNQNLNQNLNQNYNQNLNQGYNQNYTHNYEQVNSSNYEQLINFENTNQFTYEQYIKQVEETLIKTRNQKNEATFFPELFEEEEEYNFAQLANCQPTSVQKLAECAQMLKNAVVNLINYQDDASLATKAIPELINLLNDEDQIVVQNAMLMAYQLSKKDASRHAIMQSPQIIASVIRIIMDNEQNHELVKTASHLLYNVSQHKQGLLIIFKTGGINLLVKLLSYPVEIIVFYAISTLHNLLLHQEGTKMVVRLSGGLQKMVSLLARNNYKLLTYVTDCLHTLAFGNQEGKLIILASGGPQELVRIMKTYTYEKLLWTTSRVLMVLSVCTSNKPAIILAGGLQTLSMHLKNSSERLVQSCLYALRNLSDDPSVLNENLEGPITSLVDLINSEKPNIVLCVTGILSNISCNNQHAKQLICQCNAIPSLINVLIKYTERDDILEPTICVLRHLTVRQAEADFASNAIRINNGIPVLVKMINSSSRWFLIKVVVGLIRNLAFNVNNHQQFREQQAIAKLISLLIRANNEIKRNKTNNTNTLNGGLINTNISNNSVFIDGVSINDIIEGIVGALQQLFKQQINREIVKTNNDLIQVLVEILYNESENVQRVAVGVLNEIATDKEGAEKIELEGATVPLTNLLNSRNESISAYSAAILFKLSEGKSLDYKKQLKSELTSSLYRDDLNINNLNSNSNWQMSLNSASNDLDINNLLYHSQFATLNNNLNPPTLNSVNPTLYQDIYNTQNTLNHLPNAFPIDASLSLVNTNDYGTYGQITNNLQQIQTQPQTNLNGPGWFDTDL